MLKRIILASRARPGFNPGSSPISSLISRARSLSIGHSGTLDAPSSALTVFVRDTANGMLSTLHHGFKILGVTAIAAVTLMFVRPDVTDHVKAFSPFSIANAQERSSALQTSAGVTAGTLAAAADELAEARHPGLPLPAVGSNIANGASGVVPGTGVATATTLSAVGNLFGGRGGQNFFKRQNLELFAAPRRGTRLALCGVPYP